MRGGRHGWHASEVLRAHGREMRHTRAPRCGGWVPLPQPSPSSVKTLRTLQTVSVRSASRRLESIQRTTYRHGIPIGENATMRQLRARVATCHAHRRQHWPHGETNRSNQTCGRTDVHTFSCPWHVADKHIAVAISDNRVDGGCPGAVSRANDLLYRAMEAVVEPHAKTWFEARSASTAIVQAKQLGCIKPRP
jgi:hypothetical protein